MWHIKNNRQMNNYLVKKIVNLIAPIIQYSGISRIIKPIYGGRGHIIMLHRVTPLVNKTRVHNHQSLEITKDHLHSLIRYFNKHLYVTITLDELHNGLLNQNLPDKFVVYTFDDGYSDNYHIAYPIFKKYNIPFSIYITTCFPDRNVLLWWYALEDLLLSNDSLSHKDYPFLNPIKCKSQHQKEISFNRIRNELLKMNRPEIISFFEAFKINLNSYAEKMVLTWDEIIQLSKDPLVTIGAHTKNHLALAHLSEDECYNEIINSKKEIEDRIGLEVKHFSYPFGKSSQVGTREFNIANEIGFSTSTTTRLANVFSEHRDHQQALPRISVNSETSESILRANINGFFPMIRNKFKKVVTE